MSRARFLALAVLALLAPLAVVAEDSGSPHYMRDAKGEADTDKCGACHNDDMSLARSQVETCTLCHGETPHAGAVQHLHADAAAVKRIMQGKNADAPSLPLTDDGTIYCGTCHVFHDPVLSDEAILASPWLPATTGVSKAVRDSLLSRWTSTAPVEPGAMFSTRGTVRLRLSIDDGKLCRHCHGYGK